MGGSTSTVIVNATVVLVNISDLRLNNAIVPTVNDMCLDAAKFYGSLVNDSIIHTCHSSFELQSFDSYTPAKMNKISAVFKNFGGFGNRFARYGPLKVSNKFYFNKGLDPRDNEVVKPIFQTFVNTYFQSGAQSLDFSDSASATRTINQLAADGTNNGITKLILHDNLSKDTLLVIASATYLKASFAVPIVHSGSALFKSSPRAENRRLPFLYLTGYMNYGRIDELGVRFCEIPLVPDSEKNMVSMFIIVPEKIEGMDKLAQNLRDVTMDKLMNSTKTVVTVEMPNFKIDQYVDRSQSVGHVMNVFHSETFAPVEVEKGRIYKRVLLELNDTKIDIPAYSQLAVSEGHDFLVYYSFSFMIVDLTHRKRPLILMAGRYTGPSNL